MSIAPVIVPPDNESCAASPVSTYAFVAASWLAVGSPIPVILLVPIAIAPDIVPPARGSFVAIELVIVVEKLASSPIAAANSFRVSKAPGAESTRLDTDVST